LLSKHDCLDIATHREISDHSHPARGEQGDQIVEDHIGSGLVADLPITIFVDVKLQAFELDDILIWHVVYGDCGKIGKARPGTEAGKFRDLQMYYVIPLTMGVRPPFQLASFYLVYSISTRYAILFIHKGIISGTVRNEWAICATFLKDSVIPLIILHFILYFKY
jgi:hypothetical protein